MERRALERQELILGPEPQLSLTYRDPLTQARGYLVVDTFALGAVYGGIRIAKNIDIRSLAPLARLGTIRYQLARVSLGGAKCGLDYNPTDPNRIAVLERFCRALRPFLGTVLSLGPDLGVETDELEAALAKIGVQSRMHAVQSAQGWSDAAWKTYLSSLDLPTPYGAMRDVRIPYFASCATQATFEILLPKVERPRVVVVGMGPFGLQLARLLQHRGCRVLGLANAEVGCLAADGIDKAILDQIGEDISIDRKWSLEFVTYGELLRLHCDAIVFADRRQVLDISDVGKINARLVIEAAQRCVSSSAEKVLHDRGIAVLPNVALSLGGIMLTDAILSQGQPAESETLLRYLEERARALVVEVGRLASGLRITMRDAALRVAFRRWEQLPATWVSEDQA
jgi:glutamate dehydrogenase (NAD(P)+)